MDRQLKILQHSLGLDQYGQGDQYRNHFVTGPGSNDFGDCQALVAKGLMASKGARELFGGDHYFTVTPEGIKFVAENSPAPPKLSRSKRRYLKYLAASDVYDDFGHFLKSGN